MRITLPTDILKHPIEEIPGLSRKFKKRCSSCGYATLRQLCREGALEISKTENLGPDRFSELIDFLRERKLLHALDD
ncbi:hypothetical protein [Parapedobacter sp. 2B3]|uniref:hypothetical protein n=1 Tax=Parapedobacter sp. 2B3 TaxID=3342381 RepID=UPI0035B5DF4E